VWWLWVWLGLVRCLGSCFWFLCYCYFDDCWVCVYFRDEPARLPDEEAPLGKADRPHLPRYGVINLFHAVAYVYAEWAATPVYVPLPSRARGRFASMGEKAKVGRLSDAERARRANLRRVEKEAKTREYTKKLAEKK